MNKKIEDIYKVLEKVVKDARHTWDSAQAEHHAIYDYSKEIDQLNQEPYDKMLEALKVSKGILTKLMASGRLTMDSKDLDQIEEAIKSAE